MISQANSESLILKIGKSTRMNIPNSYMGNVRAHILSILEDNGETIIVFKYYSKYKECWFYRAEELSTLEIYNNWR